MRWRKLGSERREGGKEDVDMKGGSSCCHTHTIKTVQTTVVFCLLSGSTSTLKSPVVLCFMLGCIPVFSSIV